MRKAVVASLIIAMAIGFASCGIVVNNGNLKVMERDGKEIVSIGRDGFKLSGNVTGVTLDSGGLSVTYPDGSIIWDNTGFNVQHADGTIHLAGGKLVITDKNGKSKTLDTTGKGAEYSTDGGVVVKTGEKASIPAGFPSDTAKLMDGFVLNASAELGAVTVVSGYVPEKTVDDALSFYQPLLMDGNSYSKNKKDGCVVLRAKLNEKDITVYLVNSLTAHAVDVSIIAGG